MRHRTCRPWRSAVFRHLLAALEGSFWVGCGGILLAFAVWKLGSPSAAVMRLAAVLLWSVGAFLAARRAGKHGRRHGIRTGLVCGGMLCLVQLCGTVLLHEAWHSAVLLRMAGMLLAGSIGGISGVNTKLKAPPD